MNSVLSVLPASPRKKKTCFSLNHGFDDHGQAVSISPKHPGSVSCSSVCVYTSPCVHQHAHAGIHLCTHIPVLAYSYPYHFVYVCDTLIHIHVNACTVLHPNMHDTSAHS